MASTLTGDQLLIASWQNTINEIQNAVGGIVANLNSQLIALNNLGTASAAGVAMINTDVTAGLADARPGVPTIAASIQGQLALIEAQYAATLGAVQAMINDSKPALPS